MVSVQEALYERIKSRGLRLTQPRRVILEELVNAAEIVGAETIYINIHRDHPRIGLATVYRTLTLLTQAGIATKFDFGDGKARYELASTDPESRHHHVLVCEQCYKVIKYADFTEIEKQNFDRIEKKLQKTFDYEIRRHVVHYFGVCPACRKA